MNSVAIVCNGQPHRILEIGSAIEDSGYCPAVFQRVENWLHFAPFFKVVVLLEPAVATLDSCRFIRQGSNCELIVVMPERAPFALDALFENGATEVITGPISALELTGHLKAAMSRALQNHDGVAKHGDRFHLDYHREDVCVDGHPLGLTAIEYQLMLCLYQHPEVTCRAGQLIESGWGSAKGATAKTLATSLYRLRLKFQVAGLTAPFRCIRGQGYRYRKPVSNHADLQSLSLGAVQLATEISLMKDE